MTHLLSREFLACTRGSVGAEKGLGPDREGRGADWGREWKNWELHIRVQNTGRL